MAESSSEIIEPRVRVVGSSWERRPTLIDGTITKTKLSANSFNDKVGNTGLFLNFLDNMQTKYTIEGDFKPGGFIAASEQEEPIPEKDAIRMFGYGLNCFRNWAKSSGEIDLSKVDYFTSKTNFAFSRFIKNFFTKNGHGDLVKIDLENAQGLNMVGIELGKLLQLSDDDQLVKKISAIAKRSEGAIVPALVQVA